MSAQLPLIPPQNFEIIRDKIGAILSDEIPNQHTLNTSYPNISKIWIERFIQFNSETEVPTININLDHIIYSDKDKRKRASDIVYNIDIYTTSPTTDATGPGDQYSMVVMNKIAGIVMAILENPIYSPALGLTLGISTRTVVERLSILYKSQVKDALSDVVGRIQFRVEAIEENILATGIPIQESTTKVLLDDDEGFYYDLIIS